MPYGPPTTETNSGYEITFYFRKEGEEKLYEVVDMKKKLSSYFSDCSNLSMKIKNGDYDETTLKK